MPGRNTAQSLGSGVIVDASGLVVTNNHVIEGMTDVKVALADKRELAAKILLRDPRTDLAVLKLTEGSNFPTIELGDSDALEVGDLTLAIGNPFGVGQTVTQGIVSALARTHVGISDYGFFIQTDAAINPGNSGGPLVDMNGRVVGINSAIFSKSGGSVGIGFAIPVNMVKSVIAAAKGGGKQVKRPWMGATLQTLSQEIAEGFGLDRPTGALLADVDPKGPTAEAGLKRGDVIISVDGQTADDPESVGYRLGTKPLGGQATLGVLRGGKKIVAQIRLAPAPETPPRDAVKLKGQSPFSGATVVNISPAVIEELSVQGANNGVVVSEIEDGSYAQQLNLQRGDIVLAVNDQKIGSTRELEKIMAGARLLLENHAGARRAGVHHRDRRLTHLKKRKPDERARDPRHDDRQRGKGARIGARRACGEARRLRSNTYGAQPLRLERRDARGAGISAADEGARRKIGPRSPIWCAASTVTRRPRFCASTSRQADRRLPRLGVGGDPPLSCPPPFKSRRAALPSPHLVRARDAATRTLSCQFQAIISSTAAACAASSAGGASPLSSRSASPRLSSLVRLGGAESSRQADAAHRAAGAAGPDHSATTTQWI